MSPSLGRMSRRDWMRWSAAAGLGCAASPWLAPLAQAAAGDPDRKRSCILLWMSGGPSQIDTFDLKPDHANGGEFQAIETAAPGVRICEHLPGVAKLMNHLAIVRSMSTKEGDHGRATYLARTGYLQTGPIQYPGVGSLLSKELGTDDAELPNYVSIGPYRFLSPAAYGPGFLGPKFAPLVVGEGNVFVRPDQYDDSALRVKNLDLPDGVTEEQADARLDLLDFLEDDFLATRGGYTANSHRTAYNAAVRMMRSKAVEAFQLDKEPDELRDKYGRNPFGQGCLLARRLVEQGVPFVEVSLNGVAGQQVFGWDTHVQNFASNKALCGVLDPAWAALTTDLEDRGLLDSTLIVWMGEFGRTPKINPNSGRDHFPDAWSVVLGGGGIRGGQVIGRSSADGMLVEDRPVKVPDLMATICQALGIDPLNQNMSNVGRPIRLADPDASPISEVLS